MAEAPPRTKLVIDRLLSGETLDAHQIAEEYGTHKSFLRKVAAQMRRHGVQVEAGGQSTYYVPPTATSGNGNGQHAAAVAVLPNEQPKRPPEKTAAARLQRVGKKAKPRAPAAPAAPAAKAPGPAAPSSRPQPPDTRSNFDRAVEWLIAGEHLTAAELAERLDGDAKPQLIGMVIARLKAKGYQFDYEIEGKAKRWRITGKGEPLPDYWNHRPRTGGKSKGAKPRMPTPQVDVFTECVMAFRVDDDTVQFAIRQGGRTFTAQVISVME